MSSFQHNHGGLLAFTDFCFAYFFDSIKNRRPVAVQSVQRFEVCFYLFSIEQRKGQAP